MKPKHRRLTVVATALCVLGIGAALVLTALEDSIVFFHAPSDVAAGKAPADRAFRLGGLVETGSVRKVDDGGTTAFRVTDGAETVAVTYAGILPDLFRENQGVVAQGRLRGDGVFVADEVLAKHDENYMPPEVAEALKKTGHWQPEVGE